MGRSSKKKLQRVKSQPPSELPHVHHNKPRLYTPDLHQKLGVRASKVSAMEDKGASRTVKR